MPAAVKLQGVTNGISGSREDAGPPTEPIAIIGMSCRFGGDATSPTKLWDLCVNGRDSWTPIPTARFDGKSLYHPDQSRPGRVSGDVKQRR